jgi:YfiH family protein
MSVTVLPDSLPCHQYDGWRRPSPTKTKMRHGFFTASGGVSSGLYHSLNCGYGSADHTANIDENRRRVAVALGFAQDRLFGLKQCHSATAKSLSDNSSATLDKRPDADAYVSTRENAALAILTADCVPVLFADRHKAVIGAAHAGWRGATGGILAATVNRMCDEGARLASIEAVIGPAIAKVSYQVGDDCRDLVLALHPHASQFFDPDPGHAQKYYFDLPGFAKWQLSRIGIAHVVDLAIDTYNSDNRLFSHRRATHAQLPDTGRQISVIGLTDQTG